MDDPSDILVAFDPQYWRLKAESIQRLPVFVQPLMLHAIEQTAAASCFTAVYFMSRSYGYSADTAAACARKAISDAMPWADTPDTLPASVCQTDAVEFDMRETHKWGWLFVAREIVPHIEQLFKDCEQRGFYALMRLCREHAIEALQRICLAIYVSGVCVDRLTHKQAVRETLQALASNSMLMGIAGTAFLRCLLKTGDNT